jgi:hypothetical protein
MQRTGLFLFLLLFLTAALAQTALAVEKTVYLPKGTTVEKTEEGCLKFTLPDGVVVQVKGFMKSKGEAVVTGQCGVIGNCSIVSGKGKLIATGKQGRILSGKKPESGEAEANESLKMEGSTLWLPAVVQFQNARIFNRTALEKLTTNPGR